VVDFPGFPFPDQVEDKLHGNDNNGCFLTFYETIKFESDVPPGDEKDSFRSGTK